jgi:hypothetical protein
MQNGAGSGSGERTADGILLALALIHSGLHLATNGNYGIFRDELYYLACSDRLAWGYVDHPPLSIVVLAATERLLGDSVAAIRLPVALAGGLAVFLVGRLARDLGGGRTAQWTAALAYVVTATSLVLFGFFSMNAFDALAWIVCARLAARLLNGGDGRWWAALGVAVGLGLLNKYSIGFFTFAFVVALLATPERRLLAGARPWIGGALAAALFAPHLWWQAQQGFPTLEFIRAAQEQKIVATVEEVRVSRRGERGGLRPLQGRSSAASTTRVNRRAAITRTAAPAAIAALPRRASARHSSPRMRTNPCGASPPRATPRSPTSCSAPVRPSDS